MNLLTIPEAAKETRMSISWWRQQVFFKKIKYLKVGRKVLIPRQVIEDMLAKAVVEPRETSSTPSRTLIR